MDKQIRQVYKSAFHEPHNIRSIRKFLDRDALQTLYSGLPVFQISQVQIAAARLVLVIPRCEHITPILKSFHLKLTYLGPAMASSKKMLILVVFRNILLVQHPWTNLWKGHFINTNYYYYYSVSAPIVELVERKILNQHAFLWKYFYISSAT